MTRPASLAQIGRSIGVSKQAIAKKVTNGELVRNAAGEIDIDDPANQQWLIDHSADMSQFPAAPRASAPQATAVSPQSATGTPAVPPAPLPRRNQHDPHPAAATYYDKQGNPVDLSRMMLMQRIKVMQSDDALKQQKLLEGKNQLFEKKIVSAVVGGIMSEMVNAAMYIPQSIVDNLLSLRITHADREREEIVHLLQESYLHEYKRISAAVKKRLATLKNEDKKQSPDGATAEEQ